MRYPTQKPRPPRWFLLACFGLLLFAVFYAVSLPTKPRPIVVDLDTITVFPNDSPDDKDAIIAALQYALERAMHDYDTVKAASADRLLHCYKRGYGCCKK